MRIIQLNIDDQVRTLAAMRAAMLRRSMSDYISDLVLLDAENSGLAALVHEHATTGMHQEEK